MTGVQTCALPIFARMSSPKAAKEEMIEDMELSEKIIGTAIIKSVMPEHNMINLSHDPIPLLDWPAMEMDFTVKKDVSLLGLNKGDKVDFELEKGESGYVVKSITTSKNQGDLK